MSDWCSHHHLHKLEDKLDRRCQLSCRKEEEDATSFNAGLKLDGKPITLIMDMTPQVAYALVLKIIHVVQREKKSFIAIKTLSPYVDISLCSNFISRWWQIGTITKEGQKISPFFRCSTSKKAFSRDYLDVRWKVESLPTFLDMIDENQFSQDEFELQNLHNLKYKQGRPPRESEKGPYAVVVQRCEETTQFRTFWDLAKRHFYLIFCTLL